MRAAKTPDPNCEKCFGRGFWTREDGGAGTAVVCDCRLDPGERQAKQTADFFEDLADRLEKDEAE